MTLHSAEIVREATCNAAVDLIDAGAAEGTLRIYTGSPPASPEDAATGTLLAELTFSDPAFGAASTSGTATANAITDDSSANTSGVAGWFRIADSDGNALWDGTISTVGGGGDIEFDDTDFVAGGIVGIDSLTLTYPM